ncbi:hypothetical protein B0H67DRAFT_163099 [Lasiosphaeris hirsuta]|uniref:Pre-mRNA splicing factor n=1 Tax=Lasiosphaeris hirsuta TaxID=260670 RepID=A0AA40E217_9PEZI|nr:hypothetical protein B0H67DRAFT_163099 [Lasiosphaeris hirsuta]
MTIASISTPRWVSYSVAAKSGGAVYDYIGLHERCTSISASPAAAPECFHFPDARRCEASDGRSFCSLWRSTGFLMSLATVVDLAALVGFLVIMAGGKVKRESGWRILAFMLGVVAGLEFCAMALVSYLFDNDDFFLVPGYRLDTSWYLCMASAGIALFSAFGLAISAFVLPPEDGYEFLNDPTGV